MNPYCQLGTGDSGACGNNTFILPTSPTELYVQAWFRGTGWENVNTATPGYKFIAFYNTDGGYPIYYWVVDAGSGDPQIALNSNSSYAYGSTYPSLFDGAWHKVAFYFNFSTGAMHAWFDVPSPTLSNSTISANNGTHTPPVAINFSENWSSANPTGVVLVGWDDIEVWDGMPDSGTTTTCYYDPDDDGYGSNSISPETGVETCSANYYESGDLTATSGDCDDSNSAINPGATEICGNSIDDNCNSQTDENCTVPLTSGCSSSSSSK